MYNKILLLLTCVALIKMYFGQEISDRNQTLNLPEINGTTTKNTTQSDRKVVECAPGYGDSTVELRNNSESFYLSGTNNITKSSGGHPCVIVMFYLKYCQFSSLAAPHFNALPRAFPDVKMIAMDPTLTNYDILGVPTIVLIQNGRVIAKYNESEYTFELFCQFVTKHTGLLPIEKSYVTSADFLGPVISSPIPESDPLLTLSWLFIIICCGYFFAKSKWWQKISEWIRYNWRESEAHARHEHVD